MELNAALSQDKEQKVAAYLQDWRDLAKATPCPECGTNLAEDEALECWDQHLWLCFSAHPQVYSVAQLGNMKCGRSSDAVCNWCESEKEEFEKTTDDQMFEYMIEHLETKDLRREGYNRFIKEIVASHSTAGTIEAPPKPLKKPRKKKRRIFPSMGTLAFMHMAVGAIEDESFALRGKIRGNK